MKATTTTRSTSTTADNPRNIDLKDPLLWAPHTRARRVCTFRGSRAWRLRRRGGLLVMASTFADQQGLQQERT